MHLELPKARLDTFKDFARHYLMIVLSILTALGLEAWIEHAHHARAAAAASAQIETELRGNLADIHASLDANRRGLRGLEQFRDGVAKALQDGQSNEDIDAYLRANKDRFGLSLSWPHMPSQAWDVAVANQSAGWIGDDALRRYSNAYADQREADAWLTHDSTFMLDAPRMSTLRTRIGLGLPVDAAELVGVLDQMIHTAQETQSHLEQLEPQIAAALPADRRDPAPPSSAAAR
jgi:hypothetical protein